MAELSATAALEPSGKAAVAEGSQAAAVLPRPGVRAFVPHVPQQHDLCRNWGPLACHSTWTKSLPGTRRVRGEDLDAEVGPASHERQCTCLLYTSDAADE